MNATDLQQNDLFALLLDATETLPNGVFFLNSDGHILGINEAFANDLGYDKGNFEPKTIFEVNPTMSMLSWKKIWKQLLIDKQQEMETEHINKEETIFPVKMRIALLEIGKEVTCMASIENLMQANKFKDLWDMTSQIAGVGSWEWDLVKNTFLFSTEMYRIFQIPHDPPISEIQKRNFFKQYIDAEEFKDLESNINWSIKNGTPFSCELNLKIKDKHEAFQLTAQPVWLEDKTIKIYGTLQNLTSIVNRTDDLYFTKFCMDHARDMIFWVNEDGRISYVNNTTCQKLGYTSQELLTKTVKDISPYSQVDMKAHWEQLKREKSIEFESIHVTKKGEEIPVSISANYVNHRGREFNCGFVRDLSLKEKRDELITLAKHSLDQSIDLIFWLNSDGSFKYFNDAFITKSGFSRKEIEEKSVVDFFPGTKIEDFKNAWEKLRKGVVLQSSDRKMLLKNGETIVTEMTVNLVKTGKNEYSSTVLRDITERIQKEKQAQEYLRQIEELQRDTAAQNMELTKEINQAFNFSNIISRDPNYKKVLRQVEQVADTDATVLILGETGTGKELLARAVHQLSNRSEMPMIKINCGALPENLIESELFGHEKGSFTGAHQQKIGKFERANNGTIFLDEIGELPLDLQTKLLRVLQEGEIERIGGNKTIQLNVRVIAATNRNLEQQVAKKKFREDLYYRLNVFPIYNIPLRERTEDIPALVKFFTEKFAKKINKNITEVASSSLKNLSTYDFPGNVRELENMIERAVILSKSKVLTLNPFSSNTPNPATSTKFKTMEDMQRDHIIKALRKTKGKVSGKMGAAELLNMNGKTLTSRMTKLGINKQDYLKKEVK